MSDTSFSARLPSWAPKAYLVSSFACSAAYLLVDQLYPYVTGAPALKAFGIVLLALYSGLKGQGRLALALALSACGDYALALGPEAMTLGIAFFATAHLVYLSIFIGQILSKGIAKDGVILAGALCLYGGAMLWWLYPDMGELALAASLYNGIILLMAMCAAVSGTNRLALYGALLFVISDSVLAARMFKGVAIWDYGWDWGGVLVWVTYYAAQLCLTLGLTRRG